MVLALLDKGGSQVAVDEGETVLYNDSGATIRIKPNGDVEVTPKPGQNVILNSGTAKVGEVGDAVNGSMTAVAPSRRWLRRVRLRARGRAA